MKDVMALSVPPLASPLQWEEQRGSETEGARYFSRAEERKEGV